MVDYNCYNIAYEYLKNKYGAKRVKLTYKSEVLLRGKKVNEVKKLMAEFTDENYELLLNPITDEKDNIILILMRQYSYSIAVKKELYYKLMEYGVIEYKA